MSDHWLRHKFSGSPLTVREDKPCLTSRTVRKAGGEGQDLTITLTLLMMPVVTGRYSLS